jgi:hypothetical protein
MLKPFGVLPRFVSLVNDGLSTLFTELEAHRAAAILTEGIITILPRTLVARPFTPMLPSASVMIGLPALRPNPNAEAFAQMLLVEVRRREGRKAAVKLQSVLQRNSAGQEFCLSGEKTFP